MGGDSIAIYGGGPVGLIAALAFGLSPTASHLKNIVYGGHDAATLFELTGQMREATKDDESQRAMLLGLDGVRSPSLLASLSAGGR
jgi:hypothetical protein